jgi:23S rRNA (guanosine2251-2'-O)-methyltransferase
MIIYGKQVVLYILDRHSKIINEVFLTKQIDKKLFNKFAKLGKKIVRLDNKKAQALAHGGNHQGFLLDIKEFDYISLSQIKRQNFVLILDGLTDIGNIGAIIRTAYALGVGGVVVCGINNLNISAVIRTSSGAMLDIPVCLVKNNLDVLNELSQVGFSLVGANVNGIEVTHFMQLNENSKIALILGNEGKGFSKKVFDKLDFKVKISMSNDFDSLNVSVACGILVYYLGQNIKC